MYTHRKTALKHKPIRISKLTGECDEIYNLTLFNYAQFCICKELIAQELLKALLLAKITDGDMSVELHTIVRMLRYNIKALLQQSEAGTVSAVLISCVFIKLYF